MGSTELKGVLETIIKEHLSDPTISEWWKAGDITPQNLQIEVRKATGQLPTVEEVVNAVLQIQGIQIRFGLLPNENTQN